MTEYASPHRSVDRLSARVDVIAPWIDHIRRGSREERAAASRGVLRDSDRLATRCIQTLSLVLSLASLGRWARATKTSASSQDS